MEFPSCGKRCLWYGEKINLGKFWGKIPLGENNDNCSVFFLASVKEARSLGK